MVDFEIKTNLQGAGRQLLATLRIIYPFITSEREKSIVDNIFDGATEVRYCVPLRGSVVSSEKHIMLRSASHMGRLITKENMFTDDNDQYQRNNSAIYQILA